MQLAVCSGQCAVCSVQKGVDVQCWDIREELPEGICSTQTVGRGGE